MHWLEQALTKRSRIVTFAAVASVVLAACGVDRPDAATGTAPADDGGAYCTAQGGMLVERTATWDTEAGAGALVLAGRQTFCEFESTTDGSPTRISVDLVTLSSEAPTLAAIAYLSKVEPTVPATPSVNPASFSCTTDLLGASQFGPSLRQAGWVDEQEPIFSTMNYCVFADGSMIDEFGIWYHAAGVIRGADLTEKFAYRPGDAIPGVYASP